MFADWQLYALAVVGYASMTLNQIALDDGRTGARDRHVMALDPIASVVLGVTLFAGVAVTQARSARPIGIAALAAALAGIAVLAHTWEPPALARKPERPSG